jgi:hypothetical protein
MALPGATMMANRFSGIRNLTGREKLILRLALLMAIIMLLVNGVPAMTAYYQARTIQIETLTAEIEREQRLIDDAELWQQRSTAAEWQLQSLESSLFTGGSVALLTAAIQRQVRQIATETGLSINSANLAESRQSGDWVLVEQSLSFSTADQNNTLVFMQRLADTQPLLKVTRFSMRSNRNQYIGDLTVVGFSQASTQVNNQVTAARQTP